MITYLNYKYKIPMFCNQYLSTSISILSTIQQKKQDIINIVIAPNLDSGAKIQQLRIHLLQTQTIVDDGYNVDADVAKLAELTNNFTVQQLTDVGNMLYTAFELIQLYDTLIKDIKGIIKQVDMNDDDKLLAITNLLL